MPYCDEPNLIDYLKHFTGQDPIKAAACPFIDGLGIGEAVFLLFVVGGIGMAMTIRVQHPGPLLVAFILVGGFFAAGLPGIVAKVLALLVFFGLAAAGLHVYQQAQSGL